MGIPDGMYHIDWTLLMIAFTGPGAVQYDGTEESLKNELEESGFEEEDVKKIVSDVKILRRIIGL
ncbi:MAG: hypothetical protein K6T65_01500 [Peptococcaceae bacterium]|nr:hypothetical protein [Peptococcaceae bacterium]